MPMNTAAGLTLLVLSNCTGAPAGPPGGDAPATAPHAAPPPPAASPRPEAGSPDDAADADVLLRRLEENARDLRSFGASVIYRTWDSVLEKRETRQGALVYQVAEGGKRRFGILFTKRILNDRQREQRKQFVFDGDWLVEIDHETKMFIKRQVVPPGEKFDPLKLGEGPFPLPIAQARDDVVARFEATTLDRPGDEWLAARLESRIERGEVEGLLLVPKPQTPLAEDLARVELFYDRATLLPVGVHTVEPKGDSKTAFLSDVERNQPIDPEMLRIDEPDPRLWQIDIRPWGES